jgi:putative alpha-1,2-mannosidase
VLKLTLSMGMALSSLRSITDLFCRLIGNGGIAPSHTGGMSPTTGPPFAMHRWVAQTRHNYVSRLAYNITASTPQIHGFQCTMQPAIWMGESRSHAIVPGVAPTANPSEIKSNFTDRGLFFVGGPDKRGNEVISPGYYSIELEDGVGGIVFAEMTSSECRSLFSPLSNFLEQIQLRVLVICVLPSNLVLNLRERSPPMF